MEIYDILNKKTAYDQAFERLREKALSAPYLNSKAPVEPQITLRWILDNQAIVVKELIKSVRSRQLIPLPAKRSTIFTDKLRTVYSQSWPQNILQSTFCEIISPLLSKSLSDRLYSFRKGRGSHHAVRSFASYAKYFNEQKKPLFLARRDIEKYDQTINKNKLTEIFKELLGTQDDFVWELLNSFLNPVLTEGLNAAGEIPMGFHITPLAENVYLSKLDKHLENIDGLFYIRYGDDIILASGSEELMTRALEDSDEFLNSLSLRFNSVKSLNCSFNSCNVQSKHFPMVESIDYLGFNVSSDGKTFISENKLKKLKKDLKRCIDTSFFMAKNRPDQCLDSIINSINLLFELNQSDPYLNTIIFSTDNADSLRKLDTWIAKKILSKFYKGTQDKIFKQMSFAQLRARGLKSLQHIKNTRFKDLRAIN